MGLCICCCCNKNKTSCLETSLIFFQLIQIVFLILGLVLIDWDIAKKISLILNLLVLLFLLFNLTSVILFKIFREQEKIYSTQKKLCTILAYISIFSSILCIFLSIISESLISEKIYQYDHPCLYRISNRSDLIGRRLAVRNETVIKNYCDNNLIEVYDIFWYNRRSEHKDILMSYICSSIVEALSLISAFFYYNVMKRIKYCIKGKMNEDSGLIKYGPLGEYKGKVGEKIVIKVNNKNDSPQKPKLDNTFNANANANINLNTNKNFNNNIISQNNSIILNNNKVKKFNYEKEIERLEINDFDQLSDISKKNPSTDDQKNKEEFSKDLEVFY